MGRRLPLREAEPLWRSPAGVDVWRLARRMRLGTTIVYWGYIGIMENKMETTTVYWGNIGIMENKMEATILGGCQNYGPFLATLNIRCRIMTGIQKRTIILTTTHMVLGHSGFRGSGCQGLRF